MFYPDGFLGNIGGYNRPLWPAPKVGYNTVLDCVFVEESSPPTEPVSLAQAKDWMKIDVADDDTLITSLITAARQWCEGFLNISLVARTVIAIIDNCNGNSYLPYGPVNDLISIKDERGDTIETENYSLQLEQFKRLAWPCLKYIRLEYTAGYLTLPGWAVTGIKEQLLWLYDHRGDEVKKAQMSPEAEATLTPYSRVV